MTTFELVAMCDDNPQYDPETGAYIAPDGNLVDVAVYGAGWPHKAGDVDRAFGLRFPCYRCGREVVAAWQHTDWLRSTSRVVTVACPEHMPGLLAERAQAGMIPVFTP